MIFQLFAFCQSFNFRPASAASSSTSSSSSKISSLLQWLQYAHVTIDAARLVLLNDVPDCLLHVTLEGLELDTFRDRDGPQLELVFKLAQTKLVRRAPLAPAVALADVQLAGEYYEAALSRGGIAQMIKPNGRCNLKTHSSLRK